MIATTPEHSDCLFPLLGAFEAGETGHYPMAVIFYRSIIIHDNRIQQLFANAAFDLRAKAFFPMPLFLDNLKKPQLTYKI